MIMGPLTPNTRRKYHFRLAKNAADFVMEFSENPDVLIAGLDGISKRDILTQLVMGYHAYAKRESKDQAEFLWCMNSIIHYCLEELIKQN